MKTLPVNLATHYQLGTTSLAHLLRITRLDGAVYAFTSADTDVTIAGVTYRAASGLDVSSIAITAGLAVDNLELTTLDDGTTFTRADVLTGKWRNAAFVLSRYNWQAPTDGMDTLMVGTVGEVTINRTSVVAELRGLQQYLQQPVGSIISKTCRARLGDAMCTKALGPFTFTGTINSVSSQQVFADTSFAGPAYDLSYASVSSLLHLNGTNGSTTFTDAKGLTWSPVGTAQISTAQSQFGGASGLFGTTSSKITTAAGQAALQFGAGDFTVEAWVYPLSTGFRVLFEGPRDAAGTQINRSYQFLIGGGSSSYAIGATGYSVAAPVAPPNTWSHVAFVRSGSNFISFLNGAVVATNAAAGGTINNGVTDFPYTLGGEASVATSFNGYIDEFRVTKGVARYTSAFTPATLAFPEISSPGFLYPDDYFTEGLLTFTSGPNNGLTQKVKSYSNTGQFTLALPTLLPVQVGNTFSAIAGCRKRMVEDCAGKFNNVINFQGEPHLPGVDALTR